MKQDAKLFRFKEMEFDPIGEKVFLKQIDGINCTLLTCKFEKGCVIPQHHHVSEQITFVVEGCLKGNANGKEIIVRKGEGIVIPPNLPHEWIALEETTTLEFFSPAREKPDFK